MRPMLGHSSPVTSRGSSPSQALSPVPAPPPISREWPRALAPDSPHYAGGIAHSERGENAQRAGYCNGGFVKGKTDIKTAAASSVTSIPLTSLPAVTRPSGTDPWNHAERSGSHLQSRDVRHRSLDRRRRSLECRHSARPQRQSADSRSGSPEPQHCSPSPYTKPKDKMRLQDT